MADPIMVTTTLITFASFIKDLIDLGQDITKSIEMVGENRRQIRELTNDVLHTLANIANLTRGQENAFQVPALLNALGNLKAEMLHVLSACREISPTEPQPGIRGLKFQLKAWMKRDDIEAKIRKLKEHVNKCYVQFTVFSAARVEQTTGRIESVSQDISNTTLRVEQMLIMNNVESQVKARRLEGLMTGMLLNTSFGRDVTDRTIKIISSVSYSFTFKNTIWKDLGKLQNSLSDAEEIVAACQKDTTTTAEEDDTEQCRLASLTHALTTLSNCLAAAGRHDEALDAANEAVSTYTQNMSHMGSMFIFIIKKQELGVNAFHSLSLRSATSGKLDQALSNAEKAIESCRELVALAPRHWPTLARGLQNFASMLLKAGRLDESIIAAEEASNIMRKVADVEFYFLPALAEALKQLAECFSKKGDVDGASAVMSECEEVRREIDLSPPQSAFLFSSIELEEDDSEVVTSEDEPYYSPVKDDRSEIVGDGLSASDIDVSSAVVSSSLPSMVQIQKAFPEGKQFNTRGSPIASQASESSSDEPDKDSEEYNSSTAVRSARSPSYTASAGGAHTVVTGKSPGKEILNAPLEVNLTLRISSTTIDILWWVLMGVLSAAFAIVWKWM
ncbi:hypothetical protein GGX14DRAFT_619887 [Mycena pura]|uniref:Uncharacterized protein n=1 Tax=Mycena pura TaxID=153505 RepID=A0AAD6YC61_9AGAR|nr:hypothetical protein GGX14DRAFT_619887 [Mycena pura]